jgi:type IV pilus assembly protein PilN
MPRINLLPVKAAKRVGNARNELLIFAGILAFVLVGLYFWYARVQVDISDMQARLDDLKTEIAKIDKTVGQVEDFKKKSSVLEQKLDVIDKLKKQKVGPAKMLADLADIMTKQRKVWLTNMQEREGVLTLQGGAMEQENISEFQMALEQQSKFFSSITLTLVSSAKDGATSYFTWTITCRTNYAAG